MAVGVDVAEQCKQLDVVAVQEGPGLSLCATLVSPGTAGTQDMVREE